MLSFLHGIWSFISLISIIGFPVFLKHRKLGLSILNPFELRIIYYNYPREKNNALSSSHSVSIISQKLIPEKSPNDNININIEASEGKQVENSITPSQHDPPVLISSSEAFPPLPEYLKKSPEDYSRLK